MSKVRKNSSAPNSELKFRVKQGHFGLRISGYIPPAIMNKIAVYGKYWSPYDVEQYLSMFEQKGQPNSLKGWYFTNEAINVLINQGCKVLINV
ncbi:hypothetical protein GCM10027035_47670 [Emticicia sediminis]